MKKLIYIFIFLLLFSSCGENTNEPVLDFQSDKKAVELIQADNEFAVDLLREVHAIAEEENYMISPLSVAIALGMTYNGADGDTKTAFEECLRLGDFSRHEINSIHGALIDLLLNVDPNVTFEIANSIWVNQNYTLYKEFADTNIYYYDAGITNMNFNDASAKEIINSWIDEKTHGKIQDVIDQVPPDIVMYLINALYFNGTWTWEFDKENNRSLMFESEDGPQTEVEAMWQKADFGVSWQEDVSLLELPYGNKKFSMVILLPSEDKTVQDVLDIFTLENWNKWMGDISETEIEVTLPKFKYEYKTLLNDPLSEMGLGVAFGAGADLSLMVQESEEVFISRVIHQTFIDVNEKGTEAAAVTVVEVVDTAIGPESAFVVNRPFLYLIREKTSGAMVFMGKVGKPLTE